MSVLSKIIEVDETKCLNCHACIAACPVKYCNDGSGDHVKVNKELCIGCGKCIAACSHDARHGVDDFKAFLDDLESGDEIIAIAAPSVAANFPELYLNLNGWLKSVGVEAVFDVSFGAELTVKSYLKYIKAERPQTVISQPCPAIVSYIEIYQPELLPRLAPADSPMLHTMRMIREYYPRYRSYKIVVISPCFAKRREFDETGIGDYNVTFLSLEKYFAEKEIQLQDFPSAEYDNASAERAVLFSTPGGLMKTVEREAPGASRKTRKIEGPEIIYPYLKDLPGMIAQEKSPLLIDCLNCEKGCNGGTGTSSKDAPPDEIEYFVERRADQMKERYKGILPGFIAKLRVRMTVNRYWKAGLYARSYRDLSENDTIRIPDKAKLENIYRRMFKEKPEDYLNCGACGYGTCEAMAVAIHNGLNKIENCFHYERVSRHNTALNLLTKIQHTTQMLSDILKQMTAENGKKEIGTQRLLNAHEITEVATYTRECVAKGVTYIRQSLRKMDEIQESSIDTRGGIRSLGEQIKSIWEIVGIINSVAAQTKIIAFNAELEASAAGEKGKNFEIVASEIRRLADNTVLSTREIREKINEIEDSAENLVLASEEESGKIREGGELSEKLKSLFGELQLYSDNSADNIRESTNYQIKLFNEMLTELTTLSMEIDRFHGE